MAKSSWIGKSISGRYQIEEMLGQGGMSSVYKATDPNLKRAVAIKMIHPHLSNDPDFVKRFEEEAASVAQLRHPSIIQVYDFNNDDDIYYMILEFVPGETIQDHLKRLNADERRLSVTNAVKYMADICDAVDYAHQRGMIHRDIKPANLMLNVMGQAILMDFGIAKIVGGQRHTATGAVVGTAMYMAPEQITGEKPDHRADIYSLGVTLFEMLSGRPPFEADSAMTLMMMHVNDPVPNLRNLNPDTPDGLIAVINKALAKDPNDRYQSAAQMAAALRNVLGQAGAGVSAGATTIETPDATPAGPGATVVETSDMTPAGPGATVVETSDMPAEVPGGTYVEPVSTPAASSEGTQVESAPSIPEASSSGAGSAAVGSTATGSMPAAAARPKILGLSLPVLVGGGVIMLCLLAGGIYMVSQLFSGGTGALPATEEPTAMVVNTEAPTQTSTPEMTATLAESTATPTETPVPYTPTPEGPYVVITGISLDSSYYYVVDYEVHNFPSDSPQMHVHMFFDTVPPEQAGSPGSGPWKLTWGQYGDPPFRQYTESNRPANATQMCALVANPNHSVQPNSGNCMDLP